ncbi:MAG: alkaline phosphatase, partial [Holophagales bacterium]|nr:alkaline phosphatase [Holophagales bacterium]
QLAAARYALAGPNGRLALDRFPINGWSFTHSADELYTDSAAGATALATGHKTLPGRLAVDPDGAPLETIAEKAVAAGKSVGMVTDSAFLDASPAAFLVHRESRREYLAIAEDMASSGAALILGETRRSLEQHADWPAVLDAYRARGFTVVRDSGELEAAPAGAPVLGLFPHGSVGDPDASPALDDLAAAALERLDRDPDGFFLMVETEETDTYSHRNEFDRVVAGMAAFDRVARRMLDFARADGETLVLVTADHDTGGLAILGGEAGGPMRIRWATGNHTSEPVPVLAFGVGAERFGGVRDNAELGRLLARSFARPSPVTGAGESP